MCKIFNRKLSMFKIICFIINKGREFACVKKIIWRYRQTADFSFFICFPSFKPKFSVGWFSSANFIAWILQSSWTWLLEFVPRETFSPSLLFFQELAALHKQQWSYKIILDLQTFIIFFLVFLRGFSAFIPRHRFAN